MLISSISIETEAASPDSLISAVDHRTIGVARVLSCGEYKKFVNIDLKSGLFLPQSSRTRVCRARRSAICFLCRARSSRVRTHLARSGDSHALDAVRHRQWLRLRLGRSQKCESLNACRLYHHLQVLNPKF